MRFEIVVAPHPTSLPSDAEGFDPPSAGPASAPAAATLHLLRRERKRPARQLLDVFVDGANVTARVRETHGAFVLRDFALALVDLARRVRGKATVRFYDEPWEMCVERFGATACLSVYRAGPDPFVAVYDRAVPFDVLVTAARESIDRLLAEGGARGDAPTARIELASAAEQLRAVASTGAFGAHSDVRIPVPVPVAVEPDRDAPLSFGAEFAMRERASADDDDDEAAVERADLHALLFRGRVRAEIRGRPVDLGECHPLLVAERLVDLSRRAFDAWERGLPLHARGEAAGVLVGVRVSPDGELALSLGGVQGGARRAVHTFPALGVADVLEAALAFGRSLVRAILRRDRAQSSNLRLGALRRALREGTEALREASQSDSKVNPTPEPYRAYAASLGLGDARPAAPPEHLPAARLRYAMRWRAIVPGIDLRATYLCGDRIIVGAATEMWALDRATGRVLWRVDTHRGTSVVTPGGIARLAPDGTLCVHDFGNGEVTLRTRITPRSGGPVAGAVVHLPGLPKLVIVTEGEHHLVAIDLTSGEPRWRWSWGSARGSARDSRGPSRGAPRMKRAGRLVFFTCGDGALTALDVMTGAVVWRVRDRLRFRTPPTVAHDTLYTVAGGAHGVARLYCIDPFSGDVRWSSVVAEASTPCTIEGAPMVADGAVAVAARHKPGLVLAAFRPEDGAPVLSPASRARAVAPSGTSWLAVDDAFIGNAPSGELVAVDAASGALRWRHVLGPRPLEADVPRRLEPVLRCGALFVPHTDVAVLRPRDGALLGSISGADVIPDLLRVDERCDVYVAEESGHLLAFGALPRLSLVPT
ncbi:MAG TPA: PQQ-binding-like beta-propeller repeat protein [Polyangiaceae bacterium]